MDPWSELTKRFYPIYSLHQFSQIIHGKVGNLYTGGGIDRCDGKCLLINRCVKGWVGEGHKGYRIKIISKKPWY